MKIARRRRKILVFPALLILLKHCFLKQTGVLKIRNSQNFLANFPPTMGGKFLQLPPHGSLKWGGENFPPRGRSDGGEVRNFPPRGPWNGGGQKNKIGACGGLARNAYISEVFWALKTVLSFCWSCLIERKCFLLHVAYSGLLLTKQSIRRTGSVLNVLREEEGATHSRAVEPYRRGVLFTRRRRRLYYSENVCTMPVRQTRTKYLS